MWCIRKFLRTTLHILGILNIFLNILYGMRMNYLCYENHNFYVFGNANYGRKYSKPLYFYALCKFMRVTVLTQRLTIRELNFLPSLHDNNIFVLSISTRVGLPLNTCACPRVRRHSPNTTLIIGNNIIVWIR